MRNKIFLFAALLLTAGCGKHESVFYNNSNETVVLTCILYNYHPKSFYLRHDSRTKIVKDTMLHFIPEEKKKMKGHLVICEYR